MVAMLKSRVIKMCSWIKNAALSVILALLMYWLFISMIIGNLPFQVDRETKEQCALFTNGVEYSLQHNEQSIKKYKSKTNIEYSIVDCSWTVN